MTILLYLSIILYLSLDRQPNQHIFQVSVGIALKFIMWNMQIIFSENFLWNYFNMKLRGNKFNKFKHKFSTSQTCAFVLQ